MKKDRIYIIGTMGSGKSTLAKKLSKKLKIPYYDLDDIFYARKYTVIRSYEECEKLLKNLTKKKKWIIEGVYSKWVESGIKRSHLVICLEIPFLISVYRVISRRFKRKGNFNENWRDYFRMLKHNYQYSVSSKKDTWGYRPRKLHDSYIKKHNKITIHLNGTKEINKFVEEFTKK
ncbi:MAG: AAA family ATPase [Candidatus Nanoarchaeia archaeon]|nr:AAA family ATPase [Candidatus Nanoarchaeia archaeon]